MGAFGCRPLEVWERMYDLLEALLFVRAEPVGAEELSHWLGIALDEVPGMVEELQQKLRDRESGLTVRWSAGGVELVTRSDLADAIQERLQIAEPEPLSHASWEVLSIVAYRQPITRMEIEALRQTGSERALETLMSRQLIEEVGRKETLGRPILYGTTPIFMREFGLSSSDQLPPLSEDDA